MKTSKRDDGDERKGKEKQYVQEEKEAFDPYRKVLNVKQSNNHNSEGLTGLI